MVTRYKKGTPWDQTLTILWMLILPLNFDLGTPLRTPLVGLLLVSMAIHWRAMLPLIRRFWPIFLLPGFCFLSIIWSSLPQETFKFSSYLTITIAVCLYTASRITHRQLVTCLLAACSILIVASLAIPNIETLGDGTVAARGILPHKNVLGTRIFLLITAAATVLLNRNYGIYWRMLSLLMIPCGLILLVLAKSATAFLLTIFAVLILLFLNGVWRRAFNRRGIRGLLIAGGLVTISIAGLVGANMMRIDPVTTVLEGVGKDRSLTGRTFIWDMGNQVIAQNPILGVGAGAFWHPSVNQASLISIRFYVENNQFYFHNAYYEVIVHLGFIGFFIFLFVFAKIYKEIIHAWQRYHIVRDGFPITISSIILIRTITESELFSVLLLLPMLLFVMFFQSSSDNV